MRLTPSGTYLQIHCDTVPEVHAQPVRVIAWVESTSRVIELVTEGELLRLAVDVLACFDVFRSIRVNQACSDALQKGNIGFETIRVRFAAVVNCLCCMDLILHESSTDMLANHTISEVRSPAYIIG